MGFIQGFHSFTLYQSNRKVKCSFLIFNCDFCDCFHFANILIRGLMVKILIVLLEGEACFNVL